MEANDKWSLFNNKNSDNHIDFEHNINRLKECTFENMFIKTPKEIEDDEAKKKLQENITKPRKGRTKKDTSIIKFEKKFNNMNLSEEIKIRSLNEIKRISESVPLNKRNKSLLKIAYVAVCSAYEASSQFNRENGINSVSNYMLMDINDIRTSLNLTKSEASKASSIYSENNNFNSMEMAFEETIVIYCRKLHINEEYHQKIINFCNIIFSINNQFTSEIPDTLCAGLIYFYCTNIDTDIIGNEKHKSFADRIKEASGRSDMTIKTISQRIHNDYQNYREKMKKELTNR